MMSHHLKVLREAGLIAAAKRGRYIDYSLNADAVTSLSTAVAEGLAARVATARVSS